MIHPLEGAAAVLTGAGSGFGLECARIAAARRMRLVLVDIQADALQASAEEMEGLGVEVMAERVDVSSAAEMDALAERVKSRFGAPHFVFNNAGVGAGGLIWENSPQEWDWVLGVNLMGVVHGVRVFTPMMLEAAKANPQWRGHIVNTASMAGLVTPPNMGVYNVSKHAVVALTETLYQDLGLVTDQITASVLCPFFVPTGISHSERNRPQDAAQSPTASQRISQAMTEKAVQSGRVTARDVAEKVFEALQNGTFYIYSHPQALGSVQKRMEDIVHARNPSDPFADRPAVGEQLRAALR